MKKFDKVMALKKTIINNTDAPDDFESKISQAIKTKRNGAKPERSKTNLIRTLQYASALVLCFAFIIGLFYLASFIKNNKNVASEESPKQVNFNSPTPSMPIKPSPTTVIPIRSKVEILLKAFNLRYKNFERLKEIEPDLWLVVDTYTEGYNLKRTPSRTFPNDLYLKGELVEESDVLAFAKSIYGDQVELKNINTGEISTTGFPLRFNYHEAEKLYSFAPFGGTHRFEPYILDYIETDTTVIATVAYIKYSNDYMRYAGPYFNEDNVQIGTLPEGSEQPLTLEQVSAIKDKLPIRYFVFNKFSDKLLTIKSCWISEPGNGTISGRYTENNSQASIGYQPYIQFISDGTFTMLINYMEGVATYKGNYTIAGNIVTVKTTERMSYEGLIRETMPKDFDMMIVNKSTLIYTGSSNGATQYSDTFILDSNLKEIDGKMYPIHLTFADGIYNVSVEEINKMVIHNEMNMGKETTDKQIISKYMSQLSNQTYTLDPDQGDRVGGSYWISFYTDKYGEISASTSGFSRFNELDKNMYGKRIWYKTDDFYQVHGIFKALYNEL